MTTSGASARTPSLSDPSSQEPIIRRNQWHPFKIKLKGQRLRFYLFHHKTPSYDVPSIPVQRVYVFFVLIDCVK